MKKYMRYIKKTFLIFIAFFLSYTLFVTYVYGMLRKTGPADQLAGQMGIRRMKPSSVLVKVEGSDAITVLPEKIIRMSAILTSMIDDLGGISQDLVLPLKEYPISVIKDVRDVIDKRLIFPITTLIEKYSLNELIDRFNFLHFLDFSDSIKDAFKKNIIAMIELMNFTDIVKNKESIIKLDPNISEFKSLIFKVQIPYVTIVCKDESIYVPEYICNMSSYLSDALSLGTGVQSITLQQYSASLLNTIFDMIERSKDVSIYKKIEKYSFEDLAEITNCLDFLGFSQEIQKPFHYKIYAVCKQLPLPDVSKKLDSLNQAEEIFIDPVTQSLKNMIIKKTINDNDTVTILKAPDAVRNLLLNAIFSPNNKMIASGYPCLLWKINPDGSINTDQIPQPFGNIKNAVSCLAFSPDSRSIVVGGEGEENNLYVCKIDENGIVDTVPQILKGHSGAVVDLAFHPSGKMMVSVSNYKNIKVLLWRINPDGSIHENPLLLNPEGVNYINKVAFSPDGTMLICGGNRLEEGDLFVWYFNGDEILNKEPQKHPIKIAIANLSFMPKSKKFIVTGAADNFNKIGIFLCEISDQLHYKAIGDFPYGYYTSISPDGKIIIAFGNEDETSVKLFTIQNDNSIVFNGKISNFTKNLTFSNDSNTIMFCFGMRYLYIKRLLSENQQKILNDLKDLDAYQLLLIDKILDGNTDISLEKSGIPEDIIRLLKNLMVE